MNMLAPPAKHDGFSTWKQYAAYMCDHDIVLLESGVHDFAVPDRYAAGRLTKLCRREQPCTDADILPVLGNATWRLRPLESYRQHLIAVMQSWAHCKKTKPHWRGIFKTIFSPNPQKCQTDWGYNTDAWHMQGANEVARQVVESYGFEVFDSFALGLHAPSHWYNMNGVDNQHSDALADAMTQTLVNQLCNSRHGLPPVGQADM